jgi:hypothetical protein
MSRTPVTYHFDPSTGVMSSGDGNHYFMNTFTYATDTNPIAFQPSHPSPATQVHPQKEATMARSTYQVEFSGSAKPNEIIENVGQHDTSNNMLTFYGENMREVLRSFPLANVFAYGVVKDPEQIVVPKYLFRISLTDGGTKEVSADTFVISHTGADKTSIYYEFFTALSVGENVRGGTRSELTIPYDAVKYVERVDPAKASATVSQPVSHPRGSGSLADTDDPGYGDAVAKG